MAAGFWPAAATSRAIASRGVIRSWFQNCWTTSHSGATVCAGWAMPWATLGMPKLDSWGRVYLYSVSPDFADSESRFRLATPRDITVATRDAAGNLTGRPDGRITSDDQTRIGNPWPEYTGGWTNNVSFAGFDLTVFTQFSQGNDIYNGNREYTDAFGTYFDNQSQHARDRWTPDNPSNEHARATWYDSNSNARSSSRFVEDGSYVRIKNAVLGYNVPESFAGRMGFRSLRVYVQGQNLVTWTDYSGFDPEVNFNGVSNITRGIDFYTLPQARTYTIGLNVGF